MLRIRKPDGTIRLIEPPLALEKICISICTDKLVYSDDLSRDLAHLKVISDDLLEKIIAHPQFIWRRGIINAILSGHAFNINRTEKPIFISSQTDMVICNKHNGYAFDTSVTDIQSIFGEGPVIHSISSPYSVFGLRSRGFINDGRCIIYLAFNPRGQQVHYSKLSENFSRLYLLKNFDCNVDLVLSNNFLVVAENYAFSVWHFHNDQPNLIGEATYNGIVEKHLLLRLIEKLKLSADAVRSILSLRWLVLYQQINPDPIIRFDDKISTSPCFNFLVIPISHRSTYTGVCVCDWNGTIMHKLELSEVSSIEITWLSEKRFCLRKSGLMVDFEGGTITTRLNIHIREGPGYSRSLMIPDASGRHLMIMDCRVRGPDVLYIHSLYPDRTMYLHARTTFADILFDSWFILVISVYRLQKSLSYERRSCNSKSAVATNFLPQDPRNLSEGTDRLFTRSSESGQQILSMDPKNHCLILVNPEINQIHIREYWTGSDSRSINASIIKSPPYLMINNIVFDARIPLDIDCSEKN